MNIEIVNIGKYCAVRKKQKILFYTLYTFLDFSSSTAKWNRRESNYFYDNLTNDYEKAKERLARFGDDVGTPLLAGAVCSYQEMTDMLDMARDDEGLSDLILKAKEFYLLKRK